MATRRREGKPKRWTDSLDPDEVRNALNEACVDAYGDDEQHTGLLTAIENDLHFPFRARALGQTVQIVGMEWPDDDAYGLDLVCELDGERHLVEARSVELVPPLPEGHLSLAAYLDWKRRF